MRFGLFLVKTLGALLVTLALADLVVRAALPHSLRLNENFSAAYLDREINDGHIEGKTVVAGDSALWGYRVRSEDAAISRLALSGIPVENYSFEGGSTVNTYALLRLLQMHGERPKSVLFNVNLKEFNAADSAYQTLYPALERLTWKSLTTGERALLKATQDDASLDTQFDVVLSKVWALYGMRADVREQLFNAADAATRARNIIEYYSGAEHRLAITHAPLPDKFMGTYDLSALNDSNVEVAFLKKIGGLLRKERLPAVAMLTPTNHALLHEYIDAGEYDDQLRYISKVLRQYGIRVLNYDRAFPPGEFIDNDHLTARGNAHLAQMLHRDLAK